VTADIVLATQGLVRRYGPEAGVLGVDLEVGRLGATRWFSERKGAGGAG